jgi:hypothetical protein
VCLAERVGLPVPIVEIVEVDGWLVEHTSDLNIQLANHVVQGEAGLQFGSRHVIDPLNGQVLDYLPETMIGQVRNLETFTGILALDKWTYNCRRPPGGFLGIRSHNVASCWRSLKTLSSHRANHHGLRNSGWQTPESVSDQFQP